MYQGSNVCEASRY